MTIWNWNSWMRRDQSSTLVFFDRAKASHVFDLDGARNDEGRESMSQSKEQSGMCLLNIDARPDINYITLSLPRAHSRAI